MAPVLAQRMETKGELLEVVERLEGWEELSGWRGSRAVGLSAEAMRARGLSLGSPALLWPPDLPSADPTSPTGQCPEKGISEPLLVSVWPLGKLPSSAVAVHPRRFFRRLGKGGRLLCLPLPGRPASPARVVFVPRSPEPMLLKPAFEAFLATYLRDAAVFQDAPLRLRYFAQTVELAVAVVDWGEATEEVGEQLSRLSLLNSPATASPAQSPPPFPPTPDDHTPPIATSTPQRPGPHKPGSAAKAKARPQALLPTVLPKAFHIGPHTRVSTSVGPARPSAKAPSGLEMENIGGLRKVKEELELHLLSGRSSVDRILLHGPTGTGKTLIVRALSAKSPDSVLLKSPEELTERPTADLILVDPVEDLLGSGSKAPEASRRLRDLLDWAEEDGRKVLATASAADALPVDVRRRFQLEVELSVPSPEERREILGLELKRRGLEGRLSKAELREVADAAHSFTGADLKALLCLALSIADSSAELGVASSPDTTSLAVGLGEAMKRIQPSAMKALFVGVPSVRWEEVAGESELKLLLQQCVEWPLKRPELFRQMGVQPPKGILLYGPPGCSKTLVARAVATESKLNFVAVKGPELLSKWVGESERGVRELFRKARAAAPSIIFFDEIDAVAGARGREGGSGVGDRVVAQLLTEMDGLEGWSGVRVMAATNRPQALDPAILRPGRLDRAIFVPLPSADTRRGILRLHLARMSTATGLDLDALAQRTEGFSGAEVVAVVREAGMAAIASHLADAAPLLLTQDHLLKAAQSITPRTSPQALSDLLAFKANAKDQ